MSSKLVIVGISIIILILVIAVIAVACSGSATPAAPTAPPAESGGSTPAPTEAPAQPTPTTAPAASTPAAAAATPAAALPATVTALSKLNLRGGPGTNYPVVGSLAEGSSATVVGRNADSSWLVVKTGEGTAWLTADPTLVKIEGGTLADLPIVEASAPAYDAGNPKVALLLDQIPLVLHNAGSFTCVSHGGINKLSPLAEGNVIGPHAGDFVYGSDNVLFKYTGGSLTLIKENPVARFEGGAETLPFDKAMQLFAGGDIIWTGQLGQSPGRGVTGCDPAVK